MHGRSEINLPTKIGNARGALKIDGLDQFNPNDGIKLNEKPKSKKKKGGCC